ncbi:MAG TPA: glycoside hydrolase family 3 C-terminal domain-containing protein [Acidobacteriaceae bacterium]|nr:glycoside hydrolase family 3 C-terminal domain-containing protein [Acidobacteriaceae bacterium]
MKSRILFRTAPALLALACLSASALRSQEPPKPAAQHHPWDNKSLSPDQRADMVQKQLTLDEKIQLVHGTGWGALRPGAPIPPGNNWSAGFVPGIPRLGIPPINQQDSAVGVRLAALMGRYSTLLPSTLGAASSWNPEAAQLYGEVIGRELRAQGYNMSIGGGMDITREPRNGRNFEYAGEDPLLAGTMTGNLEKGVKSQHIMDDLKHYALNDQETGRTVLSANISKRAARESDLLAFEIAIGIAKPSGVMCSYNRVNGFYACENDWLLNQVLKKDFHFKGWVVSDWGATHSTVKAALAGLDQEMPGDDGYFSEALKKAVQEGKVPMSRLDDMDHRILRSMFAAGVIDYPVEPRSVVNPFEGRRDAQHIAEQSIVLLKNENNILPLDAASVHSIALIGSHADVGVLSGAGSAQVDAPGGNAVNPHSGSARWQEVVYFPSSPLRYIRKHAPNAKVEFNPGTDNASAAAFAKSADVAIVFVNQPMSEGMDRPTLALPDNQDALVSAVAAANPHTIVVLETGGPVSMPWANQVQGIVEAWYPGIGGAQALANLLFGTVNFTAKLPVTFAKSDADLPHPEVPGINLKPINHTVTYVRNGKKVTRNFKELPFFDVDYNTAGAAVGYKWYEEKNIQPLFPFGFGLSYTTYQYSDLKVDPQGRTATLTIQNTGQRAGAEIAQVYAELPSAAGERYKRLVAFDRINLAPGESKTVTLDLNPLCLSIYNVQKDAMEEIPGEYKILAGPSSADTPLTASFTLNQ